MLRVATRFREACRPGPVWRRSARLHPWLDRSATRTIPASFAERATFLGGEKLLSFVIGTGRCGSSLVTEVIARHPEVGFVSGLDDKLPGLDLPGRWNNALFRRSSPRDAGLVTFRHRSRYLERGRLRVAPSEGWNLLERQVSPLLPSTRRDLLASDLTPWLEQRLRGFFERRMRAQGLQMPWWSGFEGPSNWSLGPLPAAYSSEWERSGRSFVVLAGLGWKLLMDAFHAAAAVAGRALRGRPGGAPKAVRGDAGVPRSGVDPTVRGRLQAAHLLWRPHGRLSAGPGPG